MKRKMKERVCPKCGTKHEKSGVYCSRSCANSRVFTEESRKAKSDANKKHWESLSEEDKKVKGAIFHSYSPNNKQNYLESLMTQDWDVLGIQSKRTRVIIEQHGACAKCGLTHWNDERITLEYEHKDGNNGNNERSNVEALCPNCHSQTSTWRGRKNKRKATLIERLLD